MKGRLRAKNQQKLAQNLNLALGAIILAGLIQLCLTSKAGSEVGLFRASKIISKNKTTVYANGTKDIFIIEDCLISVTLNVTDIGDLYNINMIYNNPVSGSPDLYKLPFRLSSEILSIYQVKISATPPMVDFYSRNFFMCTVRDHEVIDRFYFTNNATNFSTTNIAEGFWAMNDRTIEASAMYVGQTQYTKILDLSTTFTLPFFELSVCLYAIMGVSLFTIFCSNARRLPGLTLSLINLTFVTNALVYKALDSQDYTQYREGTNFDLVHDLLLGGYFVAPLVVQVYLVVTKRARSVDKANTSAISFIVFIALLVLTASFSLSLEALCLYPLLLICLPAMLVAEIANQQHQDISSVACLGFIAALMAQIDYLYYYPYNDFRRFRTDENTIFVLVWQALSLMVSFVFILIKKQQVGDFLGPENVNGSFNLNGARNGRDSAFGEGGRGEQLRVRFRDSIAERGDLIEEEKEGEMLIEMEDRLVDMIKKEDPFGIDFDKLEEEVGGGNKNKG